MRDVTDVLYVFFIAAGCVIYVVARLFLGVICLLLSVALFAVFCLFDGFFEALIDIQEHDHD